MELLSSETAIERRKQEGNKRTAQKTKILLIQTSDDHLQLSDAELSFFWKLWLLFVFVHRVTAEGIVALDDDAVEADGAL